MYAVDTEKVAEITDILNATTDPAVTEELVEIELRSGNFANGENHQEWLDNASPDEIASWISATVYA